VTELSRDVLSALSVPRHGLSTVLPSLPGVPGLYAIYGSADVWAELGLGTPPDTRPLYVGKSEDSLLSRDITTHFGNGRTGSSTLRRSFAALLAERLDLHGMPRNPNKPGYFSNYGLSPKDDRKLTAWMRSRLEITVWRKGAGVVLADVEGQVIQHWQPPLNLALITTGWTGAIKAARAAMALQARNWRPPTQMARSQP
jgi:hypothetical protein